MTSGVSNNHYVQYNGSYGDGTFAWYVVTWAGQQAVICSW